MWANTSAIAVLIGLVVSNSYAASVDDQRVKQWIAGSLSVSQVDAQNTLDAAVDTERTADVERESWRRLKRCRDGGKSLDLNLAAAEHYMFMRFATGKAGDTGYRRLPQWYETFKTMAVRADLEKHIQSSDQPVSPPNGEVTRWGNIGVERGLKDYQTRENKAPSDSGLSFLSLAGTAYALYYYPAATSGSCDIRLPLYGTWDSNDPGRRWTLEFVGGKCIWTERTSAGGILRREVTVQRGADEEHFKISRENDAETLAALGFSPAIRAAVLSRSPQASYMTLYLTGAAISVEWNGLLVIKDDKANFKELRQPAQNPPKHFDFGIKSP